MSNNDDNFSTKTDLVKQQNNRFSLSKYEADLFDESKNLPQLVIRIRRVKISGIESWKVFEDTKNIFTIDGNKLSKKEKEFLRTTDGVLFLINEFKKPFKSFNALKKSLKEKISD